MAAKRNEVNMLLGSCNKQVAEAEIEAEAEADLF